MSVEDAELKHLAAESTRFADASTTAADAATVANCPSQNPENPPARRRCHMGSGPGSKPAVPWMVDVRMLFHLAVANVASTVAQTVMSLVDFWIVSRLPNETEAQAAVTSGGLVFFTVFGFLLGAMICTTTMVSQSFGAKRPRDCSAYAWQGIWLSLLFGVIGFSLWPAMPHIFALFPHESAVALLETEYTRVRFLSLGSAGITVALGHYFIGIHRPWPNTISAIVANVLNAVLSYGLIFGAWGLPAMGVAGAAQAWGIMIVCGGMVAHFWPQWGPYGPWTFATLYVMVVGMTFWTRWRRGAWEMLDIIGRDERAIPEMAVVPPDPLVGEAVMTSEAAPAAMIGTMDREEIGWRK